jgi:hypothetical protein
MEDEQPTQPPEQYSWITPPPVAPRQRTRKKSFRWRSFGSNGLFILFGLIVIVLVYSFIDRIFIDPPVNAETNRGGKTHTIQLDVLNGSGTPRLGQRFTDYLRARGFDVVEMGNYKESGVELTRVIDRSGDLTAARQVAEALGVPKERVVQQIDKNAYLDVSVVIGKDFKSLKPVK